MGFIGEDFLLNTVAARRLYHDYAEREPVLDFHSHLPAEDIAGDRQFQDLCEIWLEGDHYKWRAMRANGVAERYCTGNASPYEKFAAWAETVPFTLRNPLYHWTHLELQRYFGIGALLQGSNAKEVWDKANAALRDGELTARRILKKFRVRVLCTTDDPCDDLSAHGEIVATESEFCVYPTFRPDNALAIQDRTGFRAWIQRLERASNKSIRSFRTFLDALKQRHDDFHDQGARLSDHGLAVCPVADCTERKAGGIFERARAGKTSSSEEQEQFAGYLMRFFGQLDAKKGWTKQLHLGAYRNANTRRLQEIGPNTGFDSMGDHRQVAGVCGYLDKLEQENALPRVILYNSNPADNYAFATAIGNFQDGKIAGKIQLGSGWWFLDQKEGIEGQLNALSNAGLLSRFVGMVTDSRSFLSFPRHEYFRRVLCNLMGADMERGELPDDEKLIGGMIRRICYENARDFLRLGGPKEAQM